MVVLGIEDDAAANQGQSPPGARVPVAIVIVTAGTGPVPAAVTIAVAIPRLPHLVTVVVLVAVVILIAIVVALIMVVAAAVAVGGLLQQSTGTPCPGLHWRQQRRLCRRHDAGDSEGEKRCDDHVFHG